MGISRFFVNSIVFLLIGAQIKISSLSDDFSLIAIAIAAAIITRIISIYGLGGLSNWLANTQISCQELTLLSWVGLRGSVSIALALSVPVMLPGRQAIIDTTFGVVLFTLLVQGLTAKWLLGKLDLVGNQPEEKNYSELIARRVAFTRMLDYLAKLDGFSAIDVASYHREKNLVTQQLEELEKKIKELQNQYPELQSLDIEQLHEKLLDIEADTYAEFIRAGRLNTNLSPLLQEILIDGKEQ